MRAATTLDVYLKPGLKIILLIRDKRMELAIVENYTNGSDY